MLVRLQPGRVRVVGERGEDKGHAAVGGGDRHEPVADARPERVVEGLDLVQHLEGGERRARLARRCSAVRLERVAEAAVGVRVRGERGKDGVARRVEEEVGEAEPVE